MNAICQVTIHTLPGKRASKHNTCCTNANKGDKERKHHRRAGWPGALHTSLCTHHVIVETKHLYHSFDRFLRSGKGGHFHRTGTVHYNHNILGG